MTVRLYIVKFVEEQVLLGSNFKDCDNCASGSTSDTGEYTCLECTPVEVDVEEAESSDDTESISSQLSE
jgi:hypothetical protein